MMDPDIETFCLSTRDVIISAHSFPDPNSSVLPSHSHIALHFPNSYKYAIVRAQRMLHGSPIGSCDGEENWDQLLRRTLLWRHCRSSTCDLFGCCSQTKAASAIFISCIRRLDSPGPPSDALSVSQRQVWCRSRKLTFVVERSSDSEHDSGYCMQTFATECIGGLAMLRLLL